MLLAQAQSLAELTDASWITTGATDNAEERFREVFTRNQLPAPRVVAQAESMLTMLMMVMSSDALAISLRQYNEFPLTRSALQVIEVKENLPAPQIVIIKRTARILRTPAGRSTLRIRRLACPGAALRGASCRRNTRPQGSAASRYAAPSRWAGQAAALSPE